jgi:hypothetical protein
MPPKHGRQYWRSQVRPTLDEASAIAGLIAGDDLPGELSQWLQEHALALARYIGVEATYPGRPELRKRFAGVVQAARHLRCELEDAMMLSLFLGEDQAWAADENRTMRELHDIEMRAERASAKIPEGKGQHKGFPRPDGLAPQTVCALIISVAWEALRGKTAPKTSLEVQNACEALWGAAGGDTARRDGSKNPEGMWRDHLRSADRLRDSPFAEAIRNGLPGAKKPR